MAHGHENVILIRHRATHFHGTLFRGLAGALGTLGAWEEVGGDRGR